MEIIGDDFQSAYDFMDRSIGRKKQPSDQFNLLTKDYCLSVNNTRQRIGKSNIICWKSGHRVGSVEKSRNFNLILHSNEFLLKKGEYVNSVSYLIGTTSLIATVQSHFKPGPGTKISPIWSTHLLFFQSKKFLIDLRLV